MQVRLISSHADPLNIAILAKAEIFGEDPSLRWGDAVLAGVMRFWLR